MTRYTAAGSSGSENAPSVPLNVWLASRVLRLRAMTRACSTGRAAAVTMPRMLSADGRDSESEYAVLVVPRMAHAIAIGKNRRIAPLLPLVRVYGGAVGEVKHPAWETRANRPPLPGWWMGIGSALTNTP